MEKQIANVVFYKFYGENGEMQQACIFYADGTVKNVSTEEGLDAAYSIASAERITKGQFESMLNRERFYALSGDEFERRFHDFLGTGATVIRRPGKTPSVTPTIVPQDDESTVEPVVDNEEETIIPAVVTPVEDPEEDEESIIPPVVTPVPIGNSEETKTPSKSKKSKKKKRKNKKKKRFFKSVKSRVIAGIMAGVMLIAGIFGISKWSKNKANSDVKSGTGISMEGIESQDQAYLNLLEKTKNTAQKTAMKKQGADLDAYNRDFADKYIEEDKNIKAALTWDETMALNLAYNTYTKDQIRAMFNGSEVNSTTMTNAYKNATLQLMGAYVIETRENPVDTAMFLNDEKHQEFAQKYNELFLKCKETTGEEQIKAINAFYAELYKDFPISDEVREEGISHAEDRKQLETYKLSVVPIVAASEIMFQNKGDIDHTLSDKAIAYFNDLGLCNLAEEQFEKAETITLAAETDTTLPLYEDFKKAKTTELATEDNYNISDENRDLSKLDAFQRQVNGDILADEKETSATAGKTSTKTTTKKQTKTTTKTETTKKETTDRSEAVKAVGEEAVKNAENKANEQITKDNAAAKKEAEQKAEETRKEMQAAADQDAEKLKQDVANANKQFQEILGNVNDILNNGGTVNESDFGDYGVEFEDEHTDSTGNLNDSVIDITTDGTGAVDSSVDLPDPNETGASFDNSYTSSTGTGSNSYEDTSSYEDLPSPETTAPTENTTSDSYTSSESSTNSGVNTSGQEVYQYEEEYYDIEAAIDAYVESLEGQGEDVVGYQYTK